MKRSLILLASILALGLLVSACGKDKNTTSDTGGAATTATTEATTTATDTGGGGATAQVEIKDIKFMPHDVTVAKGGKVVWTNNDSVGHNVTKKDGPGPDFGSDTLNQGDTFEQTFDTAGKINYICTIHPGQDGTITVK
jgi:plastocyanin